MKKLVRFFWGDKAAGFYEYIATFYKRRPFRKNPRGSFGGPFNGQVNRRQIFLDLTNKFAFFAIYETGTYRGTTTEYMWQKSGVDVYTSEYNGENYGYVLAKFLFNKNVHPFHGDSRAFLKNLYRGHMSKGVAFIYLDAHWNDDLPLLEECQIILDEGGDAVIMIDDFQVKTDSGYKYDDYGNGNALTLEYLAPVKEGVNSVFFPNCPSKNETGACRGSVIIGTTEKVREILRNIPSLREYTDW